MCHVLCATYFPCAVCCVLCAVCCVLIAPSVPAYCPAVQCALYFALLIVLCCVWLSCLPHIQLDMFQTWFLPNLTEPTWIYFYTSSLNLLSVDKKERSLNPLRPALP